jgi:type IV pilus assembly protein PilP
MKKHHSLGLLFSCLLGCSLLLWGCSQQTGDPQSKKVISHKIKIQKNPVLPQTETASEIRVEKKTQMNTKLSNITASEYVTVQKASIQHNDLSATSVLADAVSKVDPFAPLFQDQPAAKKLKTRISKSNSRMPKTPLETMDISQLKLVGIIQSPSGNKALVEEASGKGYIIAVGTYIGLHAGQVRQISKDKIIIDEPLLPVEDVDYNALYNIDGKNFSIKESREKVYVDVDGHQFESVTCSIDGKDYFVDPKEMKLQKPAGEN